MMRSVAQQAWMPTIVVLTMSGCHQMMSPYGYQQYPGYQPYPQTISPGVQYQQPIQTLTPGQPYVPSGTYAPGTYSPGTGGTTPSYTNPGGGLQPIPEGNDAPLYNPGSGQNRDVPSPYMNNINSTSTGTGPFGAAASPIQTANHLQEPAPLNPPVAGLREARSAPPAVQSAQSNPFSASGQVYNPVPVRNPLPPQESIPAAPPVEDFAMPIQRQAMPPNTTPPPVNSQDDPFAIPSAPPQGEAARPAGEDSPFAAPLDFSVQKPVSESASVFGHHPEYQWLRGVVSKDPGTGTWSVVFNDAPGPNDELAGHVTLAQSPALGKLKDGDIVEIQGQLDPVVKDPLGKPVYLIAELSPLGSPAR